jgi:hypothetical protein
VGGARGANGRDENTCRTFASKIENKRALADLDAYGRIILRYILRNNLTPEKRQ